MTIVGSARTPIKNAIVAKMQADNAFTAMVTGVLDTRGVPRGQAYPYITAGDTTETDDSTFDALGYEDTCTLHIWSNQPNTDEAEAILAAVLRMFNHQPLDVQGMDHVGTWYDFSTVLGDPADARITHIPVRLRIGVGEQ